MQSTDYIEKGEGEIVLLLHSTAAGNKQWKKLIEELSPSFKLIAPNLFGYGTTPEWKSDQQQKLSDHVDLLNRFFNMTDKLSVIGHSFGGSVAMMAARRFPKKINRLILIEPNPFYLLASHSLHNAYQEAKLLRDIIKVNGAAGQWESAAAYFADYWNGSGAWDSLDPQRSDKFIRAIKPNFHEWDCVMNETVSIAEWKSNLPENTEFLFSDQTVKSISALAYLFQNHIPEWSYRVYTGAGHMAPLTHPQIINPILEKILNGA